MSEFTAAPPPQRLGLVQWLIVIVATMIANGIRKICSYDTAQFSRFSEIEVLRPDA